MKSVKWGEFIVDNLFDISRGNISNQKELISDLSGICFIAQNDDNNGFVDMVKPLNHKQFKGNLLVVGRQTGVVYYQEKDFVTTDGVLVLTAKNDFVKNKNHGLALASALNKKMSSFGYNNTVSAEKIKKIKIQLPIINGKIDLDFLERFIAELDSELIAELDVFLNVNGFKDTILTNEEEQAIVDYENLSFKPFNVIDVFNVKNSRNILSSEIVENSGDTPYLCASSENNAVSSYISYNENYLDKGNCIFIGGKTFVVSYQEKDFFSNDSHNLLLHLKNEEKRSKLNQLYLATCINKSLGHQYSWGDSISNRKIQKDIVSLPVIDNKIDFKSMETLISAIQKHVVKDMVQYVDKNWAKK